MSTLQQFRIVTASALFIGLGAIATTTSANAAILQIDQSAFTPQAGIITFSEFPLDTVNPTYTPANYGGTSDGPTVMFGGAFTGQTVGTSPFPPGAEASGVVNGNPTGPLTLDPNSPSTFIADDGSNPTSPVLSGSPLFNGPVSILFDKDLASVGLDGGYFNAIGGTAITAFARDGSVLGSVTNNNLGIQFLGLATDDSQNKIAGLQFHLVGAEPFGFAIDNLRFGNASQVKPPTTVPEPGSILSTLAFGALGAAFMLKQKNKTSV